MVRTKFLDQGSDTLVAETIIDALEQGGFSPEEAIPGLVQAIILLSEQTAQPEVVLDEAANLLADGPAAGEKW